MVDINHLGDLLVAVLQELLAAPRHVTMPTPPVEPTNPLDLRDQVETLDLICDLADHGTAVGVVLHDLDHAALIADEVVLMSRGRVHAAGTPEDVLTAANLTEVYEFAIDTEVDAATGRVRVIPRGRHDARNRARAQAVTRHLHAVSA